MENLKKLLEEIIKYCYVDGYCCYCQESSKDEHDVNCCIERLKEEIDQI